MTLEFFKGGRGMTSTNIPAKPRRLRAIQTELTEVRLLLEAAETIADGLVGVCEHAYAHDHRTKDVLAAANTLVLTIRDEKQAAEEREDHFREVHR